MRYSLPKLTIYVPKQSGDYLVQRYMEHPEFGYSQGTGEPIPLDRDAFVKHGAELVGKLLSEYPSQKDLGVWSLGKACVADRRRFAREYSEVSVTLLPEKRLQFCLIDTDETGYLGRGRDEQAVTLPLPFTSEQFVQAVEAVMLTPPA